MAKLKTGRHTSAIKAWRQSERRAARNRGVKSRIHDASREFNVITGKKDIEAARNLLPKVYSLLDKAAKKGTIHWESASRKKARFASRVRKIAQNPS